MNPIIQHLSQNAGIYITATISSFTLLFFAAVATMPEIIPQTAQEWWSWMRNSLQTATPINRKPIEPVVNQPVSLKFKD